MSENTVCPECGESVLSQVSVGGPEIITKFKCSSERSNFFGEFIQAIACKTIASLKKENEELKGDLTDIVTDAKELIGEIFDDVSASPKIAGLALTLGHCRSMLNPHETTTKQKRGK